MLMFRCQSNGYVDLLLKLHRRYFLLTVFNRNKKKLKASRLWNEHVYQVLIVYSS